MAKITYKVDRLISNNNTLELGLKTGVSLSISSAMQTTPVSLTSSAVLAYTNNLISPVTFSDANTATPFAMNDHPFKTNTNLIPNAQFVMDYVANTAAKINYHLYTKYLATPSNGHIVIRNTTRNNTGPSNPLIELDVAALYNGNEELTNGIHTVGNVDNTANTFITGFTTDAYGKILSVQARQVATSDLSFTTGSVDNYRSWTIGDGANHTGLVPSTYGSTMNNNNALQKIGVKFISTAPLSTVLSSTGDFATDTLEHTIKTELNFNSSHFDTESGSLVLATIPNVETTGTGGNEAAPEFVKVQIDDVGRVIAKEVVTKNTLLNLIEAFGANKDGYVVHKSSTNTITNATASGTYFLTSDAKWTLIPYDKISVTGVGAGSTQYPLLAANAANNSNGGNSSIYNGSTSSHTAIANNGVYLTGDGKITAVGFSGNGSQLTNLSVANINGNNGQSTIQSSLLDIPGLYTALGLASVRETENNVTTYKKNKVLITTNEGALSTTTDDVYGGSNEADGTAVLSANFISGQITNGSTIQWTNIKTLVTGIVAGEGGMRFMGVIGNPNTTGQIGWGTVEAGFKKGDFYKIADVINNPDSEGATWYYGGYKDELEVGDTIIAIADKPNNYSALSADQQRAYWSVIQGNLKNAVTMTTGSPVNNTVYNLALSSQDSGTIDTVVWRGINVTAHVDGNNRTYDIAANASSANTLKTTHTLWGQDFNGSADVSGSLTGVQNITPSANNTYSLGEGTVNNNGTGSATTAFKDAWITDIYGTLHGNATTATTADEVAHSLKIWIGPKTTDNENTPTATFNGSADQEVVISVNTLGLFNQINKLSNVGTGNAVTNITIERDSQDNTKLNYQITKDKTFLESISSDIFAIDTTTYNTISFINGTVDGKLAFYTGGSAPLRKQASQYNYSDTDSTKNNNGTLKLAGNLEAVNIKVAIDADNQKFVAHETNVHPTSNPDYGKEVLVATSNSGDYSFVSSGVTISNTTLSTSNSTGDTITIPTTGSVVTYVTNVKNDINAASKMDVFALSFDANTHRNVASTNKIPNNAVIDHIDVYITSTFSTGIKFELTDGQASPHTFISTDTTASSDNFIDIEDDAGTVYTYKYGKPVSGYGTAGFNPTVAVTPIQGSTQGSGTCYIYYTTLPR